MEGHSNQKHVCQLCYKSFSHLDTLATHMTTHGEKSKACPKCHKLFHLTSSLTEHMKVHERSEKIHKCTECDYTTDRKGNLCTHIHFVHRKPGRKFKCSHPGCCKDYIHAEHLRRHMETHSSEKRYKCGDCQYSTHYERNLQLHRLQRHTSGTTVKCAVCGQILKSYLTLRRHMKIHEEKKIECQTCGKMFRTKTEVKVHSVVHTKERKFKCHICQASFGWLAALDKHRNIVHNFKPKKWQCTKCDLSFIYESHLKSHQEKRHPAVDPEQSKVQCGKCSKILKNKHVLRYHVKRCKQAKNEKCDQCGASFFLKTELRAHYVIHTGEKAFSCPCCQAKFTKKGNLQVHMRSVHNTEGESKRFSCHHCGFKSHHKRTIQDHIVARHKFENNLKCTICDAHFAHRYMGSAMRKGP